MITKIRHTGVVVRELGKAVHFYETLGFRTSSRQVEQGSFIDQVVGLKKVKVETAKLLSPCGALLELLQYHSHPIKDKASKQMPNKLGCSHIALEVENLYETLDLIINQGGSIKNKPAITKDNQLMVIYCYDLEGNIIELVEKL